MDFLIHLYEGRQWVRLLLPEKIPEPAPHSSMISADISLALEDVIRLCVGRVTRSRAICLAPGAGLSGLAINRAIAGSSMMALGYILLTPSLRSRRPTMPGPEKNGKRGYAGCAPPGSGTMREC